MSSNFNAVAISENSDLLEQMSLLETEESLMRCKCGNTTMDSFLRRISLTGLLDDLKHVNACTHVSKNRHQSLSSQEVQTFSLDAASNLHPP